MPVPPEIIHRLALLNPGDHGRRWLGYVDGVPGAFVIEDRVEPFFVEENWRAFRAQRARVGASGSPFVAGVVDVDSNSVTLEAWSPGVSLRDLAQNHPLDVAATTRVGFQVARALGSLHGADVLCQRLSPWDVVLDSTGVARLTRVIKEPLALFPVIPNVPTGVSGNPGYLAPELLRGEEATSATDVFALGAVLFWALEGALPFAADSVFAQMQRALTEPAPRLSRPDVPEPLGVLIRRMLDRDPGVRPTAGRVVEILGRAAGGREPAVLTWSVSDALAHLRDFVSSGDLESVGAVLTAQPGLAAQSVVADYLVPHLADDPRFSIPVLGALAHFQDNPRVQSRLVQWRERDPDSEAVELPRRAQLDLGEFRVAAGELSWEEVEGGDSLRRCEACGRDIARGADAEAPNGHAEGCVRAEPSAPGFWERLRRRLSGG